VNSIYKRISLAATDDGNPEQKHKLCGIFAKVQNLQGVWDLIPTLVERLDRLRLAHEMSIGINRSI
jgi:hypothetical protein